VDPKGIIGKLQPAAGAGPRVVIPLPGALAQGSHLLSWRVTSEDGHSVSGSVVFSIGRTSGADGQSAEDPTIIISALSAPLVMTRFLLLAGLVLGVGASLFGAFIAPLGPGRRVALVALGAAALAALLSIGLQGADAHGLGTEPAAGLRLFAPAAGDRLLGAGLVRAGPRRARSGFIRAGFRGPGAFLDQSLPHMVARGLAARSDPAHRTTAARCTRIAPCIKASGDHVRE
jgi:CopC domain